MKLRNKNILVTGANGMIAYQLIKLLKDKDCNLTLTDLHDEPKFWNDVKYIGGDLRSRQFSNSICKDQDIVFSLVGMKATPKISLETPASHSIPMNQFNSNIIESAFKNDVEWFLYTSSVGVYGPAEVFYEDNVWSTFPSKNDWYGGWAKRIGELSVEACMKEYHKKNCSIVRPANIYGEWDGFGDTSTAVSSLIKKGHSDDVLEVWGDGNQIRDFMYSEDTARGMIHMVENEVVEPVNLGSGVETTIRELATIISEYFNIELNFDDTKPSGDAKRIVSTELSESYGFKPQVSLKDGLHRTMDWYKEFANGL